MIILWGMAFGALIGLSMSGFEQWGFYLGGFLGIFAGWSLRAAIRAEIGRASERLRGEVGGMVADRNATEASAPAPVARAAPERAGSQPLVVAAPAQPAKSVFATVVPATLAPKIPAEPGLVEQALAAAKSWLFGGNTIVRAGLAILFVGLSFLARYAASAGLFPVELRLSLVAMVGIGLLAVGFQTRTQKPQFALALQGAGVATIYLTVFAAAHLFEVVPVLPAFTIMIIVCALSCALALLQNAQSLAVAAFVGGYAVPLLLAGEDGSAATLFGYYTVLNLAVLAFARLRSWRLVTLIGFFGTFGVATFWGLNDYHPTAFAIAQTFLIVSVLIYALAAVFYSENTPGRLGPVVDTTLLFGPALTGFGLEVGLVHDMPFGSALAALGFAALYVALAAILIRRGRAEFRVLNEAVLAIGIGFVTVAIPLALGARWTSSAWALEGAAAFWIGIRQARWMPRLFGLLLQSVASLILVANINVNLSALPILNPAFIGAALVALAVLATAWWLRKPLPHSGSSWASGYGEIERNLGQPAFLIGFAFWWLALGLEITRVLPPVVADGDPLPVFAPAIQPLLITLGFIASAGVAMICGRKWQWPVALWPARVTLVPLAITFLGLSADGQHLLYTPNWAIWIVGLGLHYWLLYRDETVESGQPLSPLSVLRRVVHVGGVWLLTGMVVECLWLGIERGNLWDTSWADVAFLVSALAVLLLLTLWAAAARPDSERASRWPLRDHATDYGWVAALPIAALIFVGTLTTALLASGDTAPLPYIPLLNPVDLSLMLALATLLLWARTVLTMAAPPEGSIWLRGPNARIALAVLGFIVLNTVWLRFAHHAIGVPWSGDDLLASFVVQMGIAIMWTLLALGLMLFAHRRAQRIVWLTGAGLIGLVVLKLLLVDLNNTGGAVRIITFMVVGVLMLVVGYFAPLPPKAEARPTAGEATT